MREEKLKGTEELKEKLNEDKINFTKEDLELIKGLIEYYQRTRQQGRKGCKNYYKKNRDKLVQQQKEHYERNKDKILLRTKKYCEKNKDKIKKYRERNKDRIKQYNKDYQREYYNNNKTDITFRKKVNARQLAFKKIRIPKGQICQKCNIQPATRRHHEDYDKPLEVEFLCIKCDNNINEKRVN